VSERQQISAIERDCGYCPIMVTYKYRCSYCDCVFDKEEQEGRNFIGFLSPGYAQSIGHLPVGWSWYGSSLVCPKHEIVVYDRELNG
jgi:hypothetical protein